MISKNKISLRTQNADVLKSLPALLIVAFFCVFGLACRSAQESKQAEGSAQKSFDTPQQATQALVQAAGTYDVPKLLEILGADSKDLVASADPVSDKNRAVEFATLAKEKQSVNLDPKNIDCATLSLGNSGCATLSVGNEDWPFPIPIVKRNGTWYFDTKAGREEILFRRIGKNELDAIAICRGFVEAQEEYASEKHDGFQLNQYAQRIISTPGKRDGLAWQNADGTWDGPVGETVAKALAEGYGPDKPPFHGYYFKVLKGQGSDAPLGQINFLMQGAMIGGFALAAAPAQYKVTGVQTFIVSYEGVVYQKDLGPDTLTFFKGMDLYNPDKTWQSTDDEP